MDIDKWIQFVAINHITVQYTMKFKLSYFIQSSLPAWHPSLRVSLSMSIDSYNTILMLSQPSTTYITVHSLWQTFQPIETVNTSKFQSIAFIIYVSWSLICSINVCSFKNFNKCMFILQFSIGLIPSINVYSSNYSFNKCMFSY